MGGPIAGDEGVDVVINVRREKPARRYNGIVVEEEENLRTLAMRIGSDIVVMKPIACEAIVQKEQDMLISKEPPFLESKRAKLQHRY